MTEMKMYEKCLEIATKAHDGQFRKFGQEGLPYIVHPKAVAAQFEDERMKCIGILHDVIEDTPVSGDGLRKAGIPNNIVHVVEILSREEGETYFDYVARVCENTDAMRVKIADIMHNIETTPVDLAQNRYIPTLFRVYAELIRRNKIEFRDPYKDLGLEGIALEIQAWFQPKSRKKEGKEDA